MSSLISYFLDGVNLRDCGVYVSKSEGLLDRPAIKERTRVDWPDRHGVVWNHNKKRLQERVIVLHCFIKAQSRQQFVERMRSFCHLFDVDKERQLVVKLNDTDTPLVYMVDCEDPISVEKTWHGGAMVGTFELRLIESNPIKRLFTFVPEVNVSCTMRIRSTEAVTIYWGDDSVSYDVMTKGIQADDRTYVDDVVQIAHSYSEAYYGRRIFILIAGDIDALAPEDVVTNAEEMINRF